MSCIHCGSPSQDHDCMDYLKARNRELENAWIDCDEKLPEQFEEVIFYTKSMDWMFGELQNKLWWSGQCPYPLDKVTHWMNIYVPPSNKDKDNV